MQRILNWIRKHKILTITFIILIVFLPIILIHFLFKMHFNCYWIEAEWSAGEVLGYFGNILSFIGTIVLGYIAIMQTEKANQLNNELLMMEKNKIKPCFDIVSSKLYKIYLANDMVEKLNEIEKSDTLRLELLYTKQPRTGLTTDSALIELDVFNSGYSDITRIYVKNPLFYLTVCDPFKCENEQIAIFMGHTNLKVGENRKLYIHVKREFSTDEELYSKWYEENIDKLMPHMEFEFVLETLSGSSYIEKISCGSSWDRSMQNIDNTATRAIGVIEISVNEV